MTTISVGQYARQQMAACLADRGPAPEPVVAAVNRALRTARPEPRTCTARHGAAS